MPSYYRDLFFDFCIIIFTFTLGLYLTSLGFLQGADSIVFVFLSGIFFTSAFTMAPAAIVLSELSQVLPAYHVIFFGALGAMVGDYILFHIIRDRFSIHLQKALKHTKWKSLFKSFHFGFLKWLSPIIGALIIASPLPDEFGLVLMGLSKMQTRLFLFIAFIMNALGIAGIVLLSRIF